MAKQQHWMDSLVESLRARITDLIPAVGEGVKGDVPFGFKPPNPQDEIRAFLTSTPEQRQQVFQTLGPDEYQKWSTHMMKELNNKFGPAAQALLPMLEGVPLESLASGTGLDQNASMGVSAAQAELTQLLGYDPLSDGNGG